MAELRPSILVIEDDPALQRFLRVTLEAQNFIVIIADTAGVAKCPDSRAWATADAAADGGRSPSAVQTGVSSGACRRRRSSSRTWSRPWP